MGDPPVYNHLDMCALVTGAGKRIGRAIAISLAHRGFDVALHYNRSKDEVDALSHELRQRYGDRLFPTVGFDLHDWENVASLFDALPSGFGPLTLLVNNASVFEPSTLSQTDGRALMQNFSVHLFSPFLLMQEFRRRAQSGLVVNLLDTKINTHEYKHAGYLLSKKSLADLTQMAALEWAPNIRVNGIAPGPVLPANGGGGGSFGSVVAASPLAEPVGLDEITNTVGYFVDCPHVTGQIVYVDSGTHLL